MSRAMEFNLVFERKGRLYVTRLASESIQPVYGSWFSLEDLEAKDASSPYGAMDRRGGYVSPSRVGRLLYETAFGGKVGESFEEYRRRAERRGGRPGINLDFTRAPELAGLPWEYLYSPGTGFLSLRYPLRRSVSPYGRLPEISAVMPYRLKVLDVGAMYARRPEGYGILRDFLVQATPDALYRRVREGGYDVLHFTGHGVWDAQRLEGVMLGGERGANVLEIGRLGEILSTNPPRLTLFDAVRTGGGGGWSQAGSAPLAVAAERLVRHGLPAVVSVPSEMMGSAAALFEEGVYGAMAAGAPVEAAVTEARQAVHRVEGPEGAAWGLPALHTSTDPLFDPARSAEATAIKGLQEYDLTRSQGITYIQGDYRAKPGLDETGGNVPPPPGGTDSPGPPPPPPQRYLQGRFPAPVRLGDHAVLQVRIALERGGAGEQSAALREVLVPPEGLTALLVFHCPGFENRGGNSREVRIPQARDSDWVPVELKAVQEGVQALEVSAYVDGTYLGALRIEVTVDSAASTGESREHRQSLRNRRLADGEVTLRIRYDEASRIYRFQWLDGSLIPPDEVPSLPLKQTPQQAVEALVRELNDLARGGTRFTAGQTRDWLQGKGIELWDEFIPQDLQRQFWERQGRIQRLLIVSEGDPVPWELLYPFQAGTSNDAGFLAEQFPISRWIAPSVPPPTDRLDLSNGALVGPTDGSLPSALQEIETVRAILEARGARPLTTIGDLDRLLALLNEGGFGLLHFACHNSVGAAEIFLGEQPFQPAFLKRHQKRFERTAPLVFLNACRSDAKIPQYTRLGGWAQPFLAAGAGAFLGTLWEVRDESAATFAGELYRALGCGAPLGDALQQARRSIQGVPGDPTWLAYALYGDTAATVS